MICPGCGHDARTGCQCVSCTCADPDPDGGGQCRRCFRLVIPESLVFSDEVDTTGEAWA